MIRESMLAKESRRMKMRSLMAEGTLQAEAEKEKKVGCDRSSGGGVSSLDSSRRKISAHNLADPGTSIAERASSKRG